MIDESEIKGFWRNEMLKYILFQFHNIYIISRVKNEA